MVTTGNSQTELVVVGDRTNFPVNISGVETPFGFLTHFTSYSVTVSASYGSDSSDFSESGIFWTPTYCELLVDVLDKFLYYIHTLLTVPIAFVTVIVTLYVNPSLLTRHTKTYACFYKNTTCVA